MNANAEQRDQELKELQQRIEDLWWRSNAMEAQVWRNRQLAWIRRPLEITRGILIAFVVSSPLVLLWTLLLPFLGSDDHVFVVKQDGEFHVYPNVNDYRDATGGNWMHLPRGEYQLVATYHGGKWPDATRNQVSLAVCFLAAFFALRGVNQTRTRLRRLISAGPPSVSPGDAA